MFNWNMTVEASRNYALITLKVLGTIFCLTVLLSYLSDNIFIGELLASWRVQLFLASLIPPFVFLFYNSKGWAFSLALLCILQGNDIFRAPASDESPAKISREKDPITIFQFNVNYHNQNPEKLVSWLKRNHEDYDVIFLVEVTQEYREKLDELTQEYPHKVDNPSNRWLFQTVLSKLPIISHKTKDFSHSPRRYSLTRLRSPQGNQLDVYGVHLNTPMTNHSWQLRNGELQFIARDIRENPNLNKILVGDFNTTPYSSAFPKLLEQARLIAPRYTLFDNTWPKPLPAVARITIDHCLVSPAMEILSRKIGPDLGSDHLPVITEINLAKAS